MRVNCAMVAGSALVSAWMFCLPCYAQSARSDEVALLAAQIDQQISLAWTRAGAEGAPLAEDAEFLRRVSLHIAGCIPTVSTARRFLADATPDKRARYVDELLDGPGYVLNFTRLWRSAMLPEADA